MRLQLSIAFAATLALTVLAALSPARAGDLSNPASLNEKSPAVYQAKFDTSKGAFVIEVHSAERRRPLLQSGEERLL